MDDPMTLKVMVRKYLRSLGLEPVYRVALFEGTQNETVYWLSRISILDGERPFFVSCMFRGMNNGNPQMFIRIIYKSTSQTGWRIPDKAIPGIWIGKGGHDLEKLRKFELSEQITDAPIEMTRALEEIYTESRRQGNITDGSDVFFKFLSVGGSSEKNYRTVIGVAMEEYPVSLGRFTRVQTHPSPSGPALSLPDPESFEYQERGYKPGILIESFMGYSALYGDVVYSRVLSDDVSLHYLYGTVKIGNEFSIILVSVQATDQRMSRMGIKAKQVSIDRYLMIPPLEYYEQIPSHFAGASHPKFPRYSRSTFSEQTEVVQSFLEKYIIHPLEGSAKVQELHRYLNILNGSAFEQPLPTFADAEWCKEQGVGIPKTLHGLVNGKKGPSDPM